MPTADEIRDKLDISVPDASAAGAGGGAPSPVPSPNTITREEFLESQREMVSALRDLRPPTPVAVAPPPVALPEEASDEEWAANPRLASAKDRARDRMIHERELQDVRTWGTNVIGELTQRTMKGELPLLQNPKYAGEIQQHLNNMTAEQRAMPNALVTVHNYVKGLHADEFIKEEVEKAKRELVKGGTGLPVGSVNGRNMPSVPDGVPTPTELGFSEDEVEEMQNRGGLDAFAYKSSRGKHASWKEYAAASKNMKEKKGRISFLQTPKPKRVAG